MKYLFPHTLLRFSLVCILVTLLSYMPALTISARVLDVKGKPVSDASVSDGHKGIFTNQNGYFTLNSGADSLLIFKLGYERQTYYPDNRMTIITLKSRPITLSTVRVIRRYQPELNNALDRTVVSTDASVNLTNPGDALLNDSSLHSSDTRLSGETRTISLLGNLSRHTLIMLDNVPLNPNGEAFDLSTLPLENIKRMEIVKGNASFYGGSAAIGGIIYLYTDDIKTGTPLKLEQSTAAGSFYHYRHSYTVEQQLPWINYRIMLSNEFARNDFTYDTPDWWYSIYPELKRKGNRKRQQDVSLALSSGLGKVYAKYLLDRGTFLRQLPGPINFSNIYRGSFLEGSYLRHNLNLSWQDRQLADNLVFWQHETSTEYDNSNHLFDDHYQQDQSTYGVKNQLEYELAPLTATLGLEAARQFYAYYSKIPVPPDKIFDLSTNQQAISGKVLMSNEWLDFTNQLQAGLRLDATDAFGNYPSWRLEELLKLGGSLSYEAGAAYGTGFSLPSFYDLYWKGDAQSQGNPDLVPETSRGGSAWLSLDNGIINLKAAYYHSLVDDLIHWRETYIYGTVWKPFNIGRARLVNYEFSTRFNPTDWLELKSALTLTQARDLNMNANLTYTPESRLTEDLTLTRYGLSCNFNLDHNGRQWTTPDNLITPLPAVTLFNTTLQYHKDWGKFEASLWLQLNNLFDKHYEIYAYVPQPGINWLAGTRISYSR